MAETAFQEFILPGTYVRVLAEGLIGVGGISTGNIGIVGTAAAGVGTTDLFSGHAEVVPAVGDYDPLNGGAGTLNLARRAGDRLPQRRRGHLRPRASRPAPTTPRSPRRSPRCSRKTSTSWSRRS